MKIIQDPRVEKELNKLSDKDRAKISEYSELFIKYGFGLSHKYLKKINSQIWELRPDKWRLFLLYLKPDCVVIHFMRKQSQKITKETKKIIEHRTKEYTWKQK